MNFFDLFNNNMKPVIAMLHLKAGGDGTALSLAKEEIEKLHSNGINAVLVENYFGSTTDCEEVLQYLQRRYKNTTLMYGVNILDDYRKAFELANKYGAKFIQIDSVSGHLNGVKDEAYGNELKRLRSTCSAAVLGGVRFKYQPVLSGRSLEEDIKIGMERCDMIVITGEGTGKETPESKIKDFRDIVGTFPLITGAGVTLENIDIALKYTDGIIIGSWIKEGHAAEGNISVENVKMLRRKIDKISELDVKKTFEPVLKSKCLSLGTNLNQDNIYEVCNLLLYGESDDYEKYVKKYKDYDSDVRAQIGYIFAYIVTSFEGYCNRLYPIGHLRKHDIDIPFTFVGWSGTLDGFSGITFAINPLCFKSDKPRLIYVDADLDGDLNYFSFIEGHIKEYSSGIGDVRLIELNNVTDKLISQLKLNRQSVLYGVEFTLDKNNIKDRVFFNYEWRSTKDVGEYVISLARCGEFYCFFGELTISPSDKMVLLAADDFCMK